MRFVKLGLGLSLLSLALIVAPALIAGDTDKPNKVPNPRDALAKATNYLEKATAKSCYNVVCNVQGGISKSKDHAVAAASVGVTYDADVYRGLMKLNGDYDAYKTPEKGAIRKKGKDFWQDLHGVVPEGQFLERLLHFPHTVLGQALEKPEKFEWLWVGDELDVEEESTDEESTESDEPESKTGVAKGGKKEVADDWKGMPHKMRVTLKPEIALEMFTESQNSGCFGGG